MNKNYSLLAKAALCIVIFCFILFINIGKGYSQSPDDKNWSSSFGLPGVTGGLNHPYDFGPGLLYFQDTLLVGTPITEFGQQVLTGLLKWDGKKLIPFRNDGSPRFNANAYIRTMAVDSAGRLIIGGTFDSIDSKPIKHISVWDGKKWQPFGEGLNSVVNSISCSQSEVYALGGFDSSGSIPLSCLARWDGNGWHDVGGNLRSNFRAAPGRIACIDSFLYIFGSFSKPGERGFFFVGLSDGHKWKYLDDNFRLSNPTNLNDIFITIRCMTTIGKDIYFCGQFDSVGGIYSPLLAKWDGVSWSRVGDYDVQRHLGKIGELQMIQSVGGRLYAGGGYDASFIINGHTLNELSPMIFDKGKWSSLSKNSIVIDGQYGGNSDKLYISVPFAVSTEKTGVTYFGFAEYRDGQIFPYHDSTQMGLYEGEIISMAKLGGKIFVAGTFRAAGLLVSDSIMIWDHDHWSQTDFYDSVRNSLGGKINGLFAKGDSLFIFGSFDHFGKRKTDGIAMFDGKKWQTFYDSLYRISNKFWGEVNAVTTDTKGIIYVSNNYQFGLAQWSDTGWTGIPKPIPVDIQMNIGAITGGENGLFIILYSDSLFLPYPSIRKWDGSEWTTIASKYSILNIGSTDTLFGGIGFIRYHKGKLIVNGTFSQINGVQMKNIGYYDSTGWHAFGKGLDAYGKFNFHCPDGISIKDIDFDENNMYVTGGFTHADSSLSFSIAKWDGLKWSAIGSGLRGPGIPNDDSTCGCGNGIAVIDRNLYVGGNFLRAGNKSAHYFSSYSLPPLNKVHQSAININKNPISIFPDPANNYINISLNSSKEKITKAEIIDELGNTVRSFTMRNKSFDIPIQFDIHDLHSGIYFIKLFTLEGTRSQKFAIER